MRPLVLNLAFLTGLALAGCATRGMQFVADGGPYAQRTPAERIQVFESDPGGRAYVRVGRINWDYTSGTVEARLVDVLPRLKDKASQVGGDALIVRQAEYVGTPSAGKPLVVHADVIRWQP